MVVTSAAVTSVVVRTITAGVHCHWLLGPIGHHPLGHVRRWRNPTVYRLLVDLSKMEERHLIITYRFDRATIEELCTQLEPDMMSAIRHPTGIPPQVQVAFLQEDGPDGGVVTAVEPVDSDEEEKDIDNRDSVIQQYLQ
ncbi:hypothetical protein NDU88_004531 [Pleurodeles waltl]|uniref:Uncharacterized protein n=1 Tax=Pleurodeles waltl TaxID=8319 RepID=A0AAV7PG07_PLEWA|nr:hypothetical protein NDU88_004531 [Pleurodeles waltl]